MERRADRPSERPVAESIEPAADASLLALVDRLAGLLERSDLSELQVEVGETSILLRKPGAIDPPPAAALSPGPPGSSSDGVSGTAVASPASGHGTSAAGSPTEPAATTAVRAPLTGIFYGAPAPGSAPYVRVGGEVAVGQVIGLIEAMKLFNEIKSDLAGRVVKVVAENGQLVKAKQPLIEVEPL